MHEGNREGMETEGDKVDTVRQDPHSQGGERGEGLRNGEREEKEIALE